MQVDGHGDLFTCRCRLPAARLRSRPCGAGQHVICDVDPDVVAVCRVALSAVSVVNSSSNLERPEMDASVTLRRNSRVFRQLQPSLLVPSDATSGCGIAEASELQWVSRGAVHPAVAVTLELSSLERHKLLLQDADCRSLLMQTLQRHFVVCGGASVRLPTPGGLVVKSRQQEQPENGDEDLAMVFRVISTYPAAGFVRVTPATRVTFTQSKDAESADQGDVQSVGTAVSSPEEQQSKGVKVGGMEAERAALRELILLPVVYPRLRSELGVEFPKGVLLCGPPGVGKTLLVRAVVHECRRQQDGSGQPLDLKLQVINGAEILTSGRGDAEQALRTTFAAAVSHTRSESHAASVIFIDELDALCPKRETGGRGASSAHSRIVAQLLTLLDGVEGSLSRENVVIVAATNLPNAIDPALRRPGRLDREIFIAPPGPALRKHIFKVHLEQTPYALSGSSSTEIEQQRDTFLVTLADKAVGYVGADIAALCREAVMVASTRQLVAIARDRELEQWWADWQRCAQPLSAVSSSSPSLGAVVAGRAWHANPAAIIPLWFLAKQSRRYEEEKTGHGGQELEYFSFLLGNKTAPVESPEKETAPAFEVTLKDFDQAMQTVVPSALRGASGFTKDFERLGWDSIGGQAETKLALQQALEWPIKFPQTFARLGVTPPRGVLLYGPPGCSKSSIVRAAAHASGATFLSLSAAQVFSPFFGDAEAAMRQVFHDARAALPAIIFFDEIDVMVAKRDFDGSGGGEGGSSTAMRVLSTMLNEMDGVESADGLLVIGATNRPACIDAALVRPGRFDRILFVDLPAEPDRVEILRIHSRPMQLQDDVDLGALASRTPFFSGAELEVRDGNALGSELGPALLALRESLDAEKVSMRHFEEALRGVTPVSSEESMSDYLEFAEAMGHLA
ncbi:hypothetical protein BBJ28_00004309 [Nothophytophthora sp. Chile5]|nr:hypothetical protein BBJ28_00004309 [Nothophytophthora sp. Chile5]